MDQSLVRRPLPLLPTPAAGAAGAPTRGGAEAAPRVQTLVDQFLAEQADTTAVERFSQHHDGMAGNVRERFYRDLLPATPPGPGQQYAFEVDLDACSGCKACVVACNSLNALEPDETWRTVGTLVGVGDRGIVQPVTTACHHCADPGCLQGCPANAYEKDPVTGIVAHKDDECIGCRYCTLTCPYEVPQFRSELGIVRKCDLCHDRLEVGEAPACVQSCPTQAIRVAVVDLEDVGTQEFPFAAPPVATTRPTTRFLSSRDLADDVQPVDLPTVRLAHAHPPLTVMLVLTQVAVGAFGLLTLFGPTLAPDVRRVGDQASLALAAIALLASVAHLGRPLLAWRAVLGIGHSWLSREIVAFGAFAGLGVAAAAARVGLVPLSADPLAVAAAVVGVAAVLSSAMVYVVTGRAHWRWTRTVPRFLATTLTGGAAVAAVVVAASGVGPSSGPDAGTVRTLVPLAIAGAVVALVVDLLDVAARRHGPGDARGRTGILLANRLTGHVQARAGLALVGAATLAIAAVTSDDGRVAVTIAFGSLGAIALLAAELLERWWFFTAESDIRMPGGRP